MVHRLLIGLSYLHVVRHLVHRDIKPADLLINLKGGPKITDFGISVGLDNTVVMLIFGALDYLYSLFECGTGEFPYSASEGPVNLTLQILDDPSPSLPKNKFSPKFCSFIDD